MAVLVRITATGMDQATYDQMASGLHEMVKKQPGFIMHVAYPSPGGFTVGEVWDSKAQQETWFNEHVAPNTPPALMDAFTTECIELHAVVLP
jgi:heme-degrading monooxygenase HmoA